MEDMYIFMSHSDCNDCDDKRIKTSVHPKWEELSMSSWKGGSSMIQEKLDHIHTHTQRPACQNSIFQEKEAIYFKFLKVTYKVFVHINLP